MRLLHTTDLTLKDFVNVDEINYTILSHCWSQDEDSPEVTYDSFVKQDYDVQKAGWRKIERCCALAASHGYEWTWIDACCIEKSSSA